MYGGGGDAVVPCFAPHKAREMIVSSGTLEARSMRNLVRGAGCGVQVLPVRVRYSTPRGT